MTPNQQIFVEELMKIRGITEEAAVMILKMDNDGRWKMVTALAHSYNKGVKDTEDAMNKV